MYALGFECNEMPVVNIVYFFPNKTMVDLDTREQMKHFSFNAVGTS